MSHLACVHKCLSATLSACRNTQHTNIQVRVRKLSHCVCMCVCVCVCVCARVHARMYVYLYGLTPTYGYGVATVSRIDKIAGLFCRIWSLL